MRLQQGRGLEQQAQLAQASGAGVVRGGLLHARQELWQRFLVLAAVEDQLIGIGHPEADRVALTQGTRVRLLAVDKEAAALPAVFQAERAAVINHGRALREMRLSES